MHGNSKDIELGKPVRARVLAISSCSAPGPLRLYYEKSRRQSRPTRRFFGSHRPLCPLPLQLDLDPDWVLPVIEDEIVRSIAGRCGVPPAFQTGNDVRRERSLRDDSADSAERQVARAVNRLQDNLGFSIELPFDRVDRKLGPKISEYFPPLFSRQCSEEPLHFIGSRHVRAAPDRS